MLAQLTYSTLERLSTRHTPHDAYHVSCVIGLYIMDHDEIFGIHVHPSEPVSSGIPTDGTPHDQNLILKLILIMTYPRLHSVAYLE
jgi:hypothetical protein